MMCDPVFTLLPALKFWLLQHVLPRLSSTIFIRYCLPKHRPHLPEDQIGCPPIALLYSFCILPPTIFPIPFHVSQPYVILQISRDYLLDKRPHLPPEILIGYSLTTLVLPKAHNSQSSFPSFSLHTSFQTIRYTAGLEVTEFTRNPSRLPVDFLHSL